MIVVGYFFPFELHLRQTYIRASERVAPGLGFARGQSPHWGVYTRGVYFVGGGGISDCEVYWGRLSKYTSKSNEKVIKLKKGRQF